MKKLTLPEMPVIETLIEKTRMDENLSAFKVAWYKLILNTALLFIAFLIAGNAIYLAMYGPYNNIFQYKSIMFLLVIDIVTASWASAMWIKWHHRTKESEETLDQIMPELPLPEDVFKKTQTM